MTESSSGDVRERIGNVSIHDLMYEPTPNTVYYRPSGRQRPSLMNLMSTFEEERQSLVAPELVEDEDSASASFQGGQIMMTSMSRDDGGEAGSLDDIDVDADNGATKFGWTDGVLARCLLNIWGVIIYLRLGWTVGESGLTLTTVIIAISVIVTVITSISLSAICTNGEVRGGGAYYLISRSLGPTFGGSIGIIFFLANAVAVALYIVGFAETVVGTVNNPFLDSEGTWDLRLIGALTLILLFVMAMIGVNWVVKVQLGLLFVLIISFIIFIAGTFKSPDPSIGFVGYDSANFSENMKPRPGFGFAGFFEVFSVFFPAVTGIMAGANISGDLKDAQVAIPKGTLLAVGLSTIVYLLLGFIIGAVVVRVDPTNDKIGLIGDTLVFQKVSILEPIVVGGIFAATLSSALASLVGAPRVLQSLCEDNLFPVLSVFAGGYGPSNEPIPAYILTFIIAMAFTLLGELNAIAPLITNFFLVAYALVNYACFAASFSKSPGWRPSFRWYNPYVALVGAFLCVAIMFLINYITAIVTFLCMGLLYGYLVWKSPEVNWGSAGQARAYVDALNNTLRLSTTKEHIKTFRPSFLVLTGDPRKREDLLTFATYLNKGKGAMVLGSIMVGTHDEVKAEFNQKKREGLDWLIGKRIKAFLDVTIAPSLREGIQQLLRLCGLGRLRPNTVVMGYKEDAVNASDEEVDDYVASIRDAFDLHFGMAIVRKTRMKNLPTTPQGFIDVWWLVDDGGLTLLLGHLLASHPHFRGCKLRVFCLSSKYETLGDEELMMQRMLREFRITGTVKVFDGGLSPSAENVAKYQEKFGDDPEWLAASMSYIRTGELISEHSSTSSFVFVSLPLPRQTLASRLYMSWLDTLSDSLPPCVILRGNHENVLTVFS